MSTSKRCFVFDIDGTIANGDHRLPHIQKTPKDWKSYFAACGQDKPIQHVIDVLLAVSSDHEVFIFSGRSDEVRPETMAWLVEHTDIRWDDGDVYMRNAGDHRDDSLIKLEMLAALRARGYEVVLAFDDRDRVVKMWRDAGVPCAQVAPGDF